MFEDRRIPDLVSRVQLLETEMNTVINKLSAQDDLSEVLEDLDQVKASINSLVRSHKQLQEFIRSDDELGHRFREFQARKGL